MMNDKHSFSMINDVGKSNTVRLNIQCDGRLKIEQT